LVDRSSKKKLINWVLLKIESVRRAKREFDLDTTQQEWQTFMETEGSLSLRRKERGTFLTI